MIQLIMLKKLFLFIALILSSCEASDINKVYYLTFDFRNSPQEDFKQYQPLAQYLQDKTGLKFKLYISRYEGVIESIGNGNAQLAITGSIGFLKAEKLYGAKILVRGLNNQKKAQYRSFFVTRTDSKIKTLDDIKNHTFIFGNTNSTQGYIIPRIIFQQNGIDIKSIKKTANSNSHKGTAMKVILGYYDAGAIQDTLAQKYEKDGLLRIFHKSNWYPSSGIIISKNIPEDIAKKIKKALLEFNPNNEDLYNWEQTEMPLGFTDANTSDYDELRTWLKKLNL